LLLFSALQVHHTDHSVLFSVLQVHHTDHRIWECLIFCTPGATYRPPDMGVSYFLHSRCIIQTTRYGSVLFSMGASYFLHSRCIIQTTGYGSVLFSALQVHHTDHQIWERLIFCTPGASYRPPDMGVSYFLHSRCIIQTT
jgi:hypothetical protein